MTLPPLIKRWVSLGFSLIPTNQEKKPTVQWKDYQIRKPSDSELNRWFSDSNSINPAVVCGAISDGLVVLDCDDPHISELLKIDTLTIGTPSGGLHLPVRSKVIPDKMQGYRGYALDIQGEKSYALLPPAKTDKGEYRIVKDAPIKEFDNILEYLDTKLPAICGEKGKDIQKFKETIGTAILEKWVKKEYEGHNYWQAKCPFHRDSDPSLTIYDNGFHCFGCGEHGDIIDFVMKKEGIDFLRAIDMLSDISGVEAPEKKQFGKKTEQKKKKTQKKDELDTALGEFTGILPMAKEMQKKHPIYYDSSKIYWQWSHVDKFYRMVDDIDIISAIHKLTKLQGIVESRFKNEVLTAIQMTGRELRVEHPPNNWIQFRNKVYDLSTKKSLEATPVYFFANPIPHDISHSTDTPTIDKLFSSWVGTDKIQLLYEICAYCMYDGYPIHRIFCFLGRGRNGKGQFSIFLERLIGSANCTSTSIERLIQRPFEAAKLYKKKVAFIGEANFYILTNTAILKSLSGNDVVTGEFKNKQPFDFRNTAKIIITANSLPPTSDKTDGFYSRWIIADFCNQFDEGSDVVDTIPDYEYDNMVSKCLSLLSDLLKRGKFSNEGSIQERMKVYEDKSNPLGQFIDLFCTKNPEIFAPYWIIYEEFKAFCLQKGHRIVERKDFKKLIKENGFDIIEQKKFGANTWQAIVGFGLTHYPEKTEYKLSEWLEKVGKKVGLFKNFTENENPTDNEVGKVGKVGTHKGSKSNKELIYKLPTFPTFPTEDNNVTELIKLSLQEWEQPHGCINGSNLYGFLEWYCKEKDPTKTPLEIKGIVEHLIGATPATGDNGNGNGSADIDQKNSQHHCYVCGALPAKNESISSMGVKKYYCNTCYYQKYPFLSKESPKGES